MCSKLQELIIRRNATRRLNLNAKEIVEFVQ